MIRFETQDGIAQILLDNPPVNGIDDGLLDGLMARLREADADSAVRAVVLGSAVPGRFCGGLDLREFRTRTPSRAHEIVEKLYVKLFETTSSLSKPVIAAISGSVRGGGMSIAITCDMIVAAEDSTFGYPEMEVGLLPAIHYNHLPRIVGRNRAFDLLFTGRVFDAREALEMGLVSRLVPEPQLLGCARTLAALFATKSPVLMRLGKAGFARATDNGYRGGAAAAVDLVSTVFGTPDCAEGLSAFVERRAPRWGTS